MSDLHTALEAAITTVNQLRADVARLESELADSERGREEDRRQLDAATADWDRSEAALVDRGKALAQYQLACGQHQAAAFAAQAERDAMQSVFDAALAYVRTHRGNVSDEERWSRDERLRDLRVAVRLAAVDQTAPSSPLETRQTADGGEAGVVEGAGGSEAAEGEQVAAWELQAIKDERRQRALMERQVS